MQAFFGHVVPYLFSIFQFWKSFFSLFIVLFQWPVGTNTLTRPCGAVQWETLIPGFSRGRGRGRQQGSFARSKSAPSGKWDHDMYTPAKQGLRSAGGTPRYCHYL